MLQQLADGVLQPVLRVPLRTTTDTLCAEIFGAVPGLLRRVPTGVSLR